MQEVLADYPMIRHVLRGFKRIARNLRIFVGWFSGLLRDLGGKLEEHMAEQNLSREEQLVAFFVNACPEPVGRTRLMKLLYLADYEARRYLGRPVSSIPYIWYDHGPFDQQLYGWLDHLRAEGLIRDEEVVYPSGNAGHIYTPNEAPPAHDLSPDEVEILSYVCREYSQVGLRELLDDIVYQTEPMLDAKEKNARGEKLNMDLVNNLKSRAFAVPYEELLARSRQVRAGNVIPHSAAMTRLTAATHAAA